MMGLWILFLLVVVLCVTTYGYKNRKWAINDREDYYYATFSLCMATAAIGAIVFLVPILLAIAAFVGAVFFGINRMTKWVEASRDAGN